MVVQQLCHVPVVCVEGEPRAQGSLRAYRGRIVHADPNLSEWRERIAWAVRAAMPALPDGAERWEWTVVAHVYVSRPRDVDKLARAILDALTGVVWADDRHVVALGIRRWLDRQRPRLELELWGCQRK